jgi:hypothetical protein
MTERSQRFMSMIWEERNNGADTEEKLVSSILRIVSENIQSYSAQDGRIVLDKKDLLKLSEELNETNHI